MLLLMDTTRGSTEVVGRAEGGVYALLSHEQFAACHVASGVA